MIIHCPKCGQDKQADEYSTHMCVDCAKAENSRYSYLRTHQDDWMAIAKDAGIDVWLQQPGESQWEYTVWMAYRDSYPGRKPSYGVVAQQLNTTSNVVRKIAARWTFPARMQAWITECDRVTMLQRRQEMLQMNKEHIDLSQRLRDKISMAVDQIMPETLKPSDIAALARLSTELERKARVDDMSQAEMQQAMVVDNDNPDIKKSPTKQNDLAGVVNILLQAGALGNITQIGIRETKEIVAKTEEGAVYGSTYDEGTTP